MANGKKRTSKKAIEQMSPAEAIRDIKRITAAVERATAEASGAKISKSPRRKTARRTRRAA